MKDKLIIPLVPMALPVNALLGRLARILRIVLISLVLYSTAYGQTTVTFEIPTSLDALEKQTELRYCFQWLRCTSGKTDQANELLNQFENDKIEPPYRWQAAFEASLEPGFQQLQGGGLNAANILPVRRKNAETDIGEVLLLNNRKLTIPLIENNRPGGGHGVPDAVLDSENCYIIVNEPGSKIMIANIETKLNKRLWETTIPLVLSNWEQIGAASNDGFQDIRFIDRDGKRVLQVWNHFAGEYAFAELQCSDGSIRTWFSSKIAEHPNFTAKTGTK